MQISEGTNYFAHFCETVPGMYQALNKYLLNKQWGRQQENDSTYEKQAQLN